VRNGSKRKTEEEERRLLAGGQQNRETQRTAGAAHARHEHTHTVTMYSTVSKDSQKTVEKRKTTVFSKKQNSENL
jgi:hypothetical protein